MTQDQDTPLILVLGAREWLAFWARRSGPEVLESGARSDPYSSAPPKSRPFKGSFGLIKPNIATEKRSSARAFAYLSKSKGIPKSVWS